MENLFISATRLKLRFDTPKGALSVEDLWDLPLTSAKGANLDDLARQLHAAAQTTAVSFVQKTTAVNDMLKLKFDIVLHIINVRISENEAARTAQLTRERKQQIMAIIAQKETEQLTGSSMEDLRKLLESM